MAVLVILPHTFVLRLSLLPFVLWQAWRCAFRLDISVLSLWIKDGEPLNHWNLGYVVRLPSSVYFTQCVFDNNTPSSSPP